MRPFAFLVLALAALLPSFGFAEDWISYEGKEGSGKGKHIVFLSGDEEYRSEEALPMLAKILSQRHGFKCTVLFAVDQDGVINPDLSTSLPGAEALDSADAVVMLLRFRHWGEDAMKHFEGAFNRGIPIVALRTSTHAFNGFPKGSPWEKWNFGSKGGFGKQVLGETWVNHWGNHKHEATKGMIEQDAKNDPILRGVEDIFGTTDVYEAYPTADSKILVRGQVLKGMSPTDPPAVYKKKRASDRQDQDVNEPMMPVVWSRVYNNPSGKENKILCTTMGAASDLTNEGLRRMVVNGIYWGLGMDVPAKADVTLVDKYEPTMYGFGGYRRGLKPADHALGKVLPAGQVKPEKK